MSCLWLVCVCVYVRPSVCVCLCVCVCVCVCVFYILFLTLRHSMYCLNPEAAPCCHSDEHTIVD